MTHLLFLHGVGGGHHAWDGQLPYFAALGYASHSWDQPGYGHSPAVEPYSLEQIALSLKRLIDAVAKEPVVLVGHSMGGFVAQELCARFPALVKGLVLCFTSASFGGGTEFADKFVAARLGPLDEGKSMAEVAALVMPAMRGSKSDPKGLALAERMMASIPAQTYRQAVQMLTTFDRRADLSAIAVPTLLVAGSDDKAEKIRGSEFVLLEGCGHLGPMDQPDAFNAAVGDFLRRHEL
jgi:pimeloyl-ACP methyl ester carboxylesterase